VRPCRMRPCRMRLCRMRLCRMPPLQCPHAMRLYTGPVHWACAVRLCNAPVRCPLAAPCPPP
jgi:hypothetical protein